MVRIQHTQTVQILSALLELVKLEASTSKHDGLILVDYIDPDFGYTVLQLQQNTAQRTDKILWVEFDFDTKEFKVYFTTRELSTRYGRAHIGCERRVWLDEQIFKLANFIVLYLTDQPTHIDPLNGVG